MAQRIAFVAALTGVALLLCLAMGRRKDKRPSIDGPVIGRLLGEREM